MDSTPDSPFPVTVRERMILDYLRRAVRNGTLTDWPDEQRRHRRAMRRGWLAWARKLGGRYGGHWTHHLNDVFADALRRGFVFAAASDTRAEPHFDTCGLAYFHPRKFKQGELPQ